MEDTDDTIFDLRFKNFDIRGFAEAGQYEELKETLQYLYREFSAFRIMIDSFNENFETDIRWKGIPLNIRYLSDATFVDLLGGAEGGSIIDPRPTLYLDFQSIDDLGYVDPNGDVQAFSRAGILYHELLHLINRNDDNTFITHPNDSRYNDTSQGRTVELINRNFRDQTGSCVDAPVDARIF